MKKVILSILLGVSGTAQATSIHLSPEMKAGPYLGSGISGGGLQLGLNDIAGLGALYFGYTHTSAEFIITKDRLKTYRLGGQYNFESAPDIGIQFEVGKVDYHGVKTLFSTSEREGSGISGAVAWVLQVNDHFGFRAGFDVNYIDKNDTFLETRLTASLNTGITLRF